MVPAIDIAEALREAIETALSIYVVRRYSAYLDREDVKDGVYLIVAAGEDRDAKRSIDLLTITVDVAYQIALPVPTEANPDPVNNLPWADEQLAKVDAIKNLFGPAGSLREMDFAGATYLRLANTPLYRPDVMRENEIFTSVIRFEFRTEAE